MLLLHNARIYLACRSAEKARAAVEELEKLTGNTDDSVRIIILDLSDLASIKRGVASFLQYVRLLDQA